MNRIAIVLVVLIAASGCAPIVTSRVDSGSQLVASRLQLEIDGAWNRIVIRGNPAESWTMEGLPIDEMLVYSGLPDGEAIHRTAPGSSAKPYAFKKEMQPEAIVGLFDGMLSRGGSSFKLVRLEPSRFGGVSGFRFDYEVVRKIDNVRLLGLGYVAVSRGEMFALLYHAPRLAFFDRHAPRVRRIAERALIKD